MTNIRFRLPALFSTLILIILLSSTIWAEPIVPVSPDEPSGVVQEYQEENPGVKEDYDDDYYVDWYVVASQPKVAQDVALYQIYDQFPHLKSLGRPQTELMQFYTPNGQLSIYNYTWDGSPQLVIEQNADTGELLQYIDFAALESEIEAGNTPMLSQAAAEMLAYMRFEQACGAETLRVSYPAKPEVLVESDGLFVFIWTKHYLGIPNYNEQFVVAIHPYTGMPVLVIEQHDYSLVGEVKLPDNFLEKEQALELTRSNIDPVLIYVSLSEDQPQELVWFSGITLDAFLGDGSDFADMARETGVQPPDDKNLLVDKATAAQCFAESLSLDLQWYTDSYYDQDFGVVSSLMPIYVIKFAPLEDSAISVIPALIEEAEFIARVMEMLN